MRRQRQAVVLVGLVPVDAKTPAARLRPEHFLRLERSCASDFFPLSPWLKPGEASTHFYYTHTRDHEVRPCFWRYVCRPRIAEDLALKTAHKGVISGVGKGIIGTWNSQSLFFSFKHPASTGGRNPPCVTSCCYFSQVLCVLTSHGSTASSTGLLLKTIGLKIGRPAVDAPKTRLGKRDEKNDLS